MTHRRRTILKAALFAGAASLLPMTGNAALADAGSKRPNVIVIVFDDTGFSDLGAFGGEIHTPNIDALAMGGLRYNRFDTKAVCSSTRAALLSGREPHQMRMADLPSRLPKPDDADQTSYKGELPANAELLPEALKKAGYATYAVGKWHLSPAYQGGPGGPRDPADKASWPLQRGFDGYYGFLGGWTDQWNPTLIEGNQPVEKPDVPGYHLSVDLVDHAITSLDAGWKAGKPTFLYLAMGATHSPIQAPKEYIDRYKGRYDGGWDRLRAERFARLKQMGVIPADTRLAERAATDAAWDSLSEQEQRVFARFMETYAGFLEHADEQIGRLIAHVKQCDQFDDTLIVLMSDNGGAPEAGAKGGFRQAYGDKTTVAEMDAHLDELGGPTTEALYQRPWGNASSTPFPRYKLWPFAGGTRDPLIISWPRTIQDPGAIRPQYVNVVDLAPTILDVAGGSFADTIAGVEQLPRAGISVRASFLSGAASAGRPVQFFELRANRAIRVGDWKAVTIHEFEQPFEDDKWMLFNLAADYAETEDLAARYPEKLAELKAAWWVEARKYSTPPLAERPKFLQMTQPYE